MLAAAREKQQIMYQTTKSLRTLLIKNNEVQKVQTGGLYHLKEKTVSQELYKLSFRGQVK